MPHIIIFSVRVKPDPSVSGQYPPPEAINAAFVDGTSASGAALASLYARQIATPTQDNAV